MCAPLRTFCLQAAILLLALLPRVALAADVVVNNGGLPPAAANVFDDGTYAGDQIWVRNMGCPPAWPSGTAWSYCGSPGSPTVAKLASGGSAAYLQPLDSSEVIASGGSALGIIGDDSSRTSVNGAHIDTVSIKSDARFVLLAGTVSDLIFCNGNALVAVLGGNSEGPLRALGQCRVWVRAGSIASPVEAYNQAVIEFHGSDFQLDGAPIPEGLIAAPTGTLTGTLASGEPLSVTIAHNGAGDVLTGSIFVYGRTEVPGLGAGGAAACAALISLSPLARGRRAGRMRRRTH